MNLPTKLTVSRIFLAFIVIFILVFPFYTIGIEWPKYLVDGVPIKLQYIVAGFIFIIASITDYIEEKLGDHNVEEVIKNKKNKNNILI